MPRPQAQKAGVAFVVTAAMLSSTATIATGLHMEGEGTKYVAYDDARPNYVLKPGDKIKGTLTACTGHTDAAGGPPIVIGKVYTKAECDAYLQHDRKIAVATVVKYAPELYANPPTAAAMEDFVLNVGPSAFIKSTMRKLFNAGRIEEGCNELFKWKYGRVRGIMVIINGLLNRRTMEYKSCVAGLS